MLYELSVYLLYCFRSLFLGGVAGAILSIVACKFVSTYPVGNGALGNGVVPFNWLGYGLVSGAVVGLAGGLLFSYRRLRTEQMHQRESFVASNASVWPPTPKHDVSAFTTVEGGKGSILKAIGLVLLCLLLLVVGASVYMHFEILRECEGHYGGLCAP